MPNIGPLEIAIVLIIALIVIGPKKLPSFGRSAGKGLREFKDSVTGTSDTESGPSSAGRSVRELREAIVGDDDDDDSADRGRTASSGHTPEQRPDPQPDREPEDEPDREPVASAPKSSTPSS